MDKKSFLEEIRNLPLSSHLFNVVVEVDTIKSNESLNIYNEFLPFKIVPNKEVVFLVKSDYEDEQ